MLFYGTLVLGVSREKRGSVVKHFKGTEKSQKKKSDSFCFTSYFLNLLGYRLINLYISFSLLICLSVYFIDSGIELVSLETSKYIPRSSVFWSHGEILSWL